MYQKLLAQRVKHDQTGFTLSEMLIVLSIVMVISTITFIQLRPVAKEKNIEQFFEQFTNDILFAQMYAMSRGQSVQVIFDESVPSYKIDANGKDLFVRKLHPGIKMDAASLGGQFYYRSNGNINKSGTMYIFYKEKVFKIVFLLGKGRFYVLEV